MGRYLYQTKPISATYQASIRENKNGRDMYPSNQNYSDSWMSCIAIELEITILGLHDLYGLDYWVI